MGKRTLMTFRFRTEFRLQAVRKQFAYVRTTWVIHSKKVCICSNGLITRSVEMSNRSNDLDTRLIKTLIRSNDLVTRLVKTLIRSNDLVTRLVKTSIPSNNLVTRSITPYNRLNDSVTRSLSTSIRLNDLRNPSNMEDFFPVLSLVCLQRATPRVNLKRPSLFSQNSLVFYTSRKTAFPRQLESVNTWIFKIPSRNYLSKILVLFNVLDLMPSKFLFILIRQVIY